MAPQKILAALLCLFLALALPPAAMAQSAPTYYVVTTCGTLPAGVTYTAGQARPPTIDTNGNVCGNDSGGGSSIAPSSLAANSITPGVTAINSTSLVLKASPGNVYDSYCYSSAAGNCILYNAVAAPGAGALTAALVLECVPVSANGAGSFSYNPGPAERATVGAVLLFSSATGEANCNTYTASSTAYLHGRAQ